MAASHDLIDTLGYQLDESGRPDPTQTTSYQRSLGRFLRGKVGKLDADIRELIQEGRVFENEWADLSQAQQTRAFDRWLDEEIDEVVLGAIATDDRVRELLEKAAERGLKDARASIREAARLPVSEGGLTTEEMQALEAELPDPEQMMREREMRDAIEAEREELRQRVKSHMDSFAGDARQIVSAGLSAGVGPSTIVFDIVERGRTAKSNSTASASAQIVNTFNTRKVEDYWDEVEADLEIEADVEYRTAGDDRVCELCQGLAARDWTLEEASEFNIPGDTHPHCRCTFQVTQVSEVF